jgi:chitosanase
MYRRGHYYRRKYHFPLFPREMGIIAVALLLGLGGTIVAMQATGRGDEELAARTGRKTQNTKQAKKQAVTPQSLVGAAASTVAGVAKVGVDLGDPQKKEIAMRLVSTAENSSTDWRAQFAYIEDIGDGRGYTAGIIGFCSGTGDMLDLVNDYTSTKADNALAPYLPALRKVNGTDSHEGLGDAFVQAWKTAANDSLFQQAQERQRDKVYFNPAVTMAKADGLSVLGQFAYYDAAVMHGPDAWGGGLPDLRNRALAKAKTPAQGGDEKTYLQAFLDVRKAEMSKDAAHRDLSRINDIQEAFLQSGNLNLNLPLTWKVYGDPFSINNL